MWNNGAKNSIASKTAKCTSDIALRVDINATHGSAKEVDRLLKPTNPLPQTIRQSCAAAIGQGRLHDTNAVDRLKRPKAIAAQRSGAALGFTRPAIRAPCSICEERATELRTKCEFAAHAPMSAIEDQNADFAASYFGLTARLKKNLI